MLASGCGPGQHARESGRRQAEDQAANAPYQSDVEEGLGAAVAILVDTSGSMAKEAPGDSRPKFVVAQQALEAMLDATDAFIAKRPDFPIKIGLYSFSSSVHTVRPILPYDRAALRAALTELPRPGGGTGIGDAMREARPDLYRAGVFRKYLLVVTDGDNTHGRDPEDVAREIWGKSEGAVQVYFVAFDTSPGEVRLPQGRRRRRHRRGHRRRTADCARRHLYRENPGRGGRRGRAGTCQEMISSYSV